MIAKLIPLSTFMLAVGAQELPDPNHFATIGWVIVSIAAVLTILKLGMDLWRDHFRETPPPAQTYVTIPACEAHRARMEKRIDECRQDGTKGDEDLETDIKNLGEKIDQATEKMATEASRRASTAQQRMDSIERKLARVEERSEATQAELRLLNQNLMTYLREVRG